MINLKTCSHVFYAAKNKLPHNLQSRYSKVFEHHDHNTRQTQLIFLNKAQSQVKSMCISIKGVNQYNDLPQKIKNVISTQDFKAKYKEMVFESY